VGENFTQEEPSALHLRDEKMNESRKWLITGNLFVFATQYTVALNISLLSDWLVILPNVEMPQNGVLRAELHCCSNVARKISIQKTSTIFAKYSDNRKVGPRLHAMSVRLLVALARPAPSG
jgi:hypothetical protein